MLQLQPNPANHLFKRLPSGPYFRCTKACATQLRNRFLGAPVSRQPYATWPDNSGLTHVQSVAVCCMSSPFFLHFPVCLCCCYLIKGKCQKKQQQLKKKPIHARFIIPLNSEIIHMPNLPTPGSILVLVILFSEVIILHN